MTEPTPTALADARVADLAARMAMHDAAHALREAILAHMDGLRGSGLAEKLAEAAAHLERARKLAEVAP